MVSHLVEVDRRAELPHWTPSTGSALEPQGTPGKDSRRILYDRQSEAQEENQNRDVDVATALPTA